MTDVTGTTEQPVEKKPRNKVRRMLLQLSVLDDEGQPLEAGKRYEVVAQSNSIDVLRKSIGAAGTYLIVTVAEKCEVTTTTEVVVKRKLLA